MAGNLLNFLNRKMFLKEKDIQVIIAQVIDCLFYIHSTGLIYGDIKAENILISQNGTIKICDFNLSGTPSMLANTVQGTICYISPEMIEDDKRTYKTDFWSMGVLIHLLFYRKYPFKNKNQRDLLRNILNVNLIKEPRDRKASPELRSLIKCLLTKRAGRRLGNRIEDFQQHPFFKNLNWESYFRDKQNFKYAQNYSLSELDGTDCSDQHTKLKEVESKMITKNESGLDYNVYGFTYETGTDQLNGNHI